MSMTNRLDPELVAPLHDYLALLGGQPSLEDIPATRALLARIQSRYAGQACLLSRV